MQTETQPSLAQVEQKAAPVNSSHKLREYLNDFLRLKPKESPPLIYKIAIDALADEAPLAYLRRLIATGDQQGPGFVAGILLQQWRDAQDA